MDFKTVLNVALILGLGVVSGLIYRESKRTVLEDGKVVLVQSDLSPLEASKMHSVEIENPDPILPTDEDRWISKFELTERSGDGVTEKDLLGQPYVVSFFFTTCPSVCTMQNQKLAELQQAYKGTPLKILAITVDPEFDTPEVLREYASRFGADDQQWLFLTGDLGDIRRLGQEVYQQTLMKQLHTERLGLVHPDGHVVGIYTWSSRRQYKKMIEKIDELIELANDGDDIKDVSETNEVESGAGENSL